MTGIDFSDKRLQRERALATEFLPREVPIFFSGANFLVNFLLNNDHGIDSLTRRILEPSGSHTVPFQFDAAMGDGKWRDLHLIHPAEQISASQFYQDYQQVIIDRCLRSRFSLRHPSGVANVTLFVADEDRETNEKFSQIELTADNAPVFKSYFVYERYTRLYKFHDGEEYLELERRYPRLSECDVSKCFYNIYTHSIAWAVKDKWHAKSNKSKNKGFESKFDGLMQSMNYAETNGIPVGPEISRIFAEIILQDVDVAVEVDLRSEGLEPGSDYDVRRYVDNYYIYSFSYQVEERVHRSLERKLKDYKLYINENKSRATTRPFISPQSVVILEIKELMQAFYEDVFESLERSFDQGDVVRPRLARDRKMTWRAFLRQYRAILVRNGMGMGEGSTLIFGVFRKWLTFYAKNGVGHMQEDDEIFAAHRLAEDFGRIMRFIVGTSPSVGNLDSAISCLLILQTTYEQWGYNSGQIVDELVEHAFDDLFLEGDSVSNNLELLTLEFCYFLPLRRRIEELRPLDEEMLLDCWRRIIRRREGEKGQFPYWVAIGILYYIQGRDGVGGVRQEIVDDFVSVARQTSVLERSDIALSFLDFGGYPEFSPEQRQAIWDAANAAQLVKDVDSTEYVNTRREWYVNWNTRADLGKELAKRVLRSAYN